MRTVAQRRAMRRAVRTRCQAVNDADFQLIGERVIDLSPRGMLIVCSALTRVGDELTVSFRMPGHEELWFDAEAVVARVIEGQRSEDDGYGAGLEFTYFDERDCLELSSRLVGYPPPVPKRVLRYGGERQHERSHELQLCSSVFGGSRACGSAGVTGAYRAPRGTFS